MDVFLFALGTMEMIVIAIVGLLLFGRRLPEVGRSVGKSFIELKRGMADMQSEMFEVDRMADEAARKKKPAIKPAARTEKPAGEIAAAPASEDDRREPDGAADSPEGVEPRAGS